MAFQDTRLSNDRSSYDRSLRDQCVQEKQDVIELTSSTARELLSNRESFRMSTKATGKAVRIKSKKVKFEDDRMKSFSKVQFLEYAGLLGARFDAETNTFERSFRHRLKASLILLLLTSLSFKLYLSTLFKRSDPIQLAIGNASVQDINWLN